LPERGELEHFLEGLFGELDKLGDELSERRRALVAERQQIEQRLRQQGDELDRQRATIEEQKQRDSRTSAAGGRRATAEFAEAMVQQRGR